MEAKALPANGFERPRFVLQGGNTEADGSGTAYTDGQSAQDLTAEYNGPVALYAQRSTGSGDFTVSGNEYTIQTAAGWDTFCDMLADNSKGVFDGKIVKLGADISVTRMADGSQHDFAGTFDGQSHKFDA